MHHHTPNMVHMHLLLQDKMKQWLWLGRHQRGVSNSGLDMGSNIKRQPIIKTLEFKGGGLYMVIVSWYTNYAKRMGHDA